MNAYGLHFHHLGLAVPAPDVAFRLLGALGYQAGAQTFDPLQNVNLAMRHHASEADVEVIWPGDGPSPIDQIIKRGNMIYHLCYVADDAETSLAALQRDGFNLWTLGPAKPAKLFGGTPVSFHRIEGFGLIELIHGEPKPLVA